MPPLAAAIGSIVSSISAFAASSWIAGFITRVALSIGLSVLSRALQKKPTFQTPGITNEATQTGGTDPQAIILGRYATGGQLVTPPMTHGVTGGTPNSCLTYVIAVSDAPGVTLSRLLVDGHIATIGGAVHPQYGTPAVHKGVADRLWVKWYDGSQTVADPMLLAKYGTHPQRPWTTDMVGVGTAYAILTFWFDNTVYKSFPAVRFEVDGISLYDPRKDPSLGGSGTHDWSNPSTWAQTNNPAVMIYNILRGIPIPGGDVWGGGWDEADLPVADWVAAMNICDEPVALAAGGTEPRYRAGLEVPLDQEPASVIEELLKTCAGRVTDVGGLMKIVVGPPGVPVKGITDEDIVITDEQSAALFPSLASTHNGVHASFPDPASLWESRDAPPRYDLTAEVADGRRLIATVSLPACPYADQVQRLMQSWIGEERRFRRHQLILPPDATILEPHDVISWTSDRNGYSAKFFEVAEVAHDPVSLLQAVSLREVDPADYDWNTSLELPWVAPVTGTNLPPAQVVPNFDAVGTSLDDEQGNPRRPVIILTWDGANQADVAALEYELRLLGGTQVVTGATLSVATGSLVISAGIIPDTNYEVRARFIAPRPVVWTPWKGAATPVSYISPSDFGTQLDTWFAAAGISVPRIVMTLPPNNGSRVDNEWVYVIPAKKLYRWSATSASWVSVVDPEDIPDGGLLGQKIAFSTLVAGLFAAGAIKAGDIDIDGNLRLDAAGAGFSIGKNDAADFDSTGLYAGRRIAPGGGIGFGFLLGTTSVSGVQRSLEASDDKGLTAINMTHGLLTDISLAGTSITSSQTVAITPGTKAITLTVLGGGGANQGGTNGGQTRVQLYNNGVPTGTEWISLGGIAGGSTTINGLSSVLGSGGIGGNKVVLSHRSDGTYIYSTAPGTAATGFGAGGGGYSDSQTGISRKGGGAALPTYVVAFDVSGLANPTLVITIGASGTKSGTLATNPSPGVVNIKQVTRAIVPAGVIPFAPTATGQFTKAANASGPAVFPDFGNQKGLWVLWTANGSTLDLTIGVDSIGTTIIAVLTSTVTFVSDRRPNVPIANSLARTIQYAFYRMSVED